MIGGSNLNSFKNIKLRMHMCVHVCFVRPTSIEMSLIYLLFYFVNKCSSSRSTEEGNRETEASVSPTEPQEDGKCCTIIAATL
jgi:hypothetical protein